MSLNFSDKGNRIYHILTPKHNKFSFQSGGINSLIVQGGGRIESGALISNALRLEQKFSYFCRILTVCEPAILNLNQTGIYYKLESQNLHRLGESFTWHFFCPPTIVSLWVV
jgi:hypothetical protein